MNKKNKGKMTNNIKEIAKFLREPTKENLQNAKDKKMETNDYWFTKKRLFGKSLLFYLNFFIIQWFFTRLSIIVNDNMVVKGIKFLKPVLPISGWFNINYIYILNIKQRIKKWKI